MKRHFGIRAKLLTPALAGLLLVFFIIFAIWQPAQLKNSKKEFIQLETGLLATLTPSIIQNLLSNDLSELYRVFENSLKIHEDEWVYVELQDAQHRRVYPVFDKKPEVKGTLIKIDLTVEEDDEVFGYVSLYADWKSHRDKDIQQINQTAILAVLLFLFIALFSLYLQTKWIYIPINQLKEATSAFSEGAYLSQLPEISFDEIGQLTESIDTMRNTIRKTLDEITNKEKMNRAILETAPDAIITMDKQGMIKAFNPGAEAIFGYRSDEVIGRTITVLMPEDIGKDHHKFVQNFTIEQSKTIGRNRDLLGVKKNGDTFPIELAINAKKIEGELLFTGVLRDITERRKVEKIKNEFIATVSHELRTPLTAIKGSLDLITHASTIEFPEDVNVMLELANRNVDRLLTLINDILDVSKLESGEVNLKLENLNLKTFLEDTIVVNQQYAKKYNTTYQFESCPENIVVSVDRSRLEQVMSNLLSNAAKYSPENIPVEISAEVHNQAVRVNIKDQGPGIPGEFQEKLFEKFTQSDSGDTRQVGGTGLGLNISKMIIEKLGGTIGFTTIEGEGSTFYFDLPLEQAEKKTA